jgi:rhodanese-related sulfurtransferase
MPDAPETERRYDSGPMSASLFDRSTPNAAGYRDVSVNELSTHLESASVRLVDVREPDEFGGELGHVRDAELVPLATVTDRATGWAKDQEIVLICRSGNRSGRAATELAKRGHTRLMNMTGGMLAWNAARLPTER